MTADEAPRYEALPYADLPGLYRMNPDADCWKVTHIGRPCGPNCLVMRKAQVNIPLARLTEEPKP